MNNIGRIRQMIDRDVFDYQSLMQCLSDYSKPRDKIKRLIDAGDIIRIKKGLYLFGEAYRRAPVSRELLANLIYGPSYVSLDYALARHGLIPEKISAVTSVTTGRSQKFSTPFGLFVYRHLNERPYPAGVLLHQNRNGSFMIASPEKALADKVWADKRFAGGSITEYAAYLVEDLRIDRERLLALNPQRLEDVRAAYSTRKIDRLIVTLRQIREKANA